MSRTNSQWAYNYCRLVTQPNQWVVKNFVSIFFAQFLGWLCSFLSSKDFNSTLLKFWKKNVSQLHLLKTQLSLFSLNFFSRSPIVKNVCILIEFPCSSTIYCFFVEPHHILLLTKAFCVISISMCHFSSSYERIDKYRRKYLHSDFTKNFFASIILKGEVCAALLETKHVFYLS